MLRKIVAALILVPLAIIIIAFAVANRQIVTVSFDPFSASEPAAALTLPLFVIVMVTLIAGVIVGGLAVRFGHGRWRRMARRLEREVQALRKKVEAHEGAPSGPTIIPDAGAPPQRLKLKPPVRQ